VSPLPFHAVLASLDDNASNRAKLEQIELLQRQLDKQRQSIVDLQNQENIPPRQPKTWKHQHVFSICSPLT
jgi:hypothetical protein